YQRTERMLHERSDPGTDAQVWQIGFALDLQDALAEASIFLKELLAPARAASADRPENPFGLTTRERDVLRLLAEGKSDREIADTLFIGTRTVETHVSNLIAKLGVHNRTEAAALATREQLV